MSRRREVDPKAELLRALHGYLGGLRPHEWKGIELHMGAEGGAALVPEDLIVELDIRIRRRPDYRAQGGYLERALFELERMSYFPRECGCITNRKERFGNYHRTCGRAIAVAVVDTWRPYYSRAYEPARLRFRFHCAQHAESYKTDREVLAVVALPAFRLKPIREAVERRDARRRAEERQWEEFALLLRVVTELVARQGGPAHPEGCICPIHRPAAAARAGRAPL